MLAERDEGGGFRPAGIVERGFVQRCQDAVERVSLVHDSAFTAGFSVGSTPGSASSDGERSPPLIPLPPSVLLMGPVTTNPDRALACSENHPRILRVGRS